MSQIKWRARRDENKNIKPGCWETDNGYSVTEFRTPEVTFAVYRPGEKEPFAYTPKRFEVAALIDADERAMA